MKRLIILGLCLLLAAGVQAQEVYRSSGKPKYNTSNKKKNEETFVQKLVFGGGVTLGFGDYTNLGISPVVGYRITDHFSAGIGLAYQYVRINHYFDIPDHETLTANLFAASVWARYLVWRNFFGQAEFEQNFMNFKVPGYDPGGSGDIVELSRNYRAPCVLLGIGYRQPIGDRASVNFSLHYDVLNDEYSPYGKQLFPRIQFLIGF